MNMSDTFRFPGLWPYVERAAEGADLPHLGHSKGLWHCKQVQDALGQYPALDAESRRELLARVRSVRDALAATVRGIDLAVRESVEAVEGAPAAEALAAAADAAPKSTAARRRRA